VILPHNIRVGEGCQASLPVSTSVAGMAVTTDIAPALTGESDYHKESDDNDGDHQANHDLLPTRPHESTVLRLSLDPGG